MISCRDWWPSTKHVFITLTWRQSNNEWSGGIASHPAQKIRGAKISWKSSRLNFLGTRRHSPHWLSSKGPGYQRGVLLISSGAIGGHFKGNNSAVGRSPRGSCSCTTVSPAHRALATQKIIVSLGFQFLDHPPYYQDLDPSYYHLFLGLKEKQMEILSIFRRTRRSLLPRRPGWTDNILNYFWVACKSFRKGLRIVRGGNVEKIPTLVAVACFLLSQTKNLSALCRTYWFSTATNVWRTHFNVTLYAHCVIVSIMTANCKYYDSQL